VAMRSMSTGTAIRVGADVATVRHVADSVAHFGDRYLQHEIASCAGSPVVAAAGLAARFAAKEATIKVLRPVGHQPGWRSIEVRRDAGGWCSMCLSGHAATLAAADRAGITVLEVSLAHEDGIAAAVVVALCRDSTNPPNGVGIRPSENATVGSR
jgi:holo-[acyl-carrier protein] synthase